jgi:hypothetical protein
MSAIGICPVVVTWLPGARIGWAKRTENQVPSARDSKENCVRSKSPGFMSGRLGYINPPAPKSSPFGSTMTVGAATTGNANAPSTTPRAIFKSRGANMFIARFRQPKNKGRLLP